MRNSVGVVVGRFQVAQLHKGHRALIEFVRSKHERVLIVLGESKALTTARNPLAYEMRRVMLNQAFPDVLVVKLADHPSDETWSSNLDQLIATICPGCEAVLYGSRDSFLSSYSGILRTEFVPVHTNHSGTAERNTEVRQPGTSLGFRRGVIYSHVNRRPIIYPAVDAAVIHEERREVLLAGKETDGDKLRFIGGFVDPDDGSSEAAAKREVHEETAGIEVDNFRYLGSLKVDDWRYRGSADGIMTTFFRASYIFGCPRPADDIVRLAWVTLKDCVAILVPEHRPLGEMLMRSLEQ